MGTSAARRGAVAVDGLTGLPAWTARPVPGLAEHVLDLPARAPALGGERLGQAEGPLLLAAHAKVVAALTGEPDVTVGYVPADAREPVPCRLRVEGTWERLVEAARRAHHAAERAGPPPGGPLPEDRAAGSLLDMSGLPWPAEELPGVALRVGLDRTDGRSRLRLRYRTTLFDAAHAARIAGYHRTALELMGTDPAADHDEATLLSAKELHLQVHGMAGPARELPGRCFHELFEERVREHPDETAGICGDRCLTYAQLNDAANRVARALLARGTGREEVVGVVTERDLDWMAAVLGVFKAGAVYLPLEPDFPPDRMAATLTRAGCRLVLTRRGDAAALRRALTSLPDVVPVELEEVFREDHAGDDLGLRIDPGRLAYVYFTSGSTGEPKGAMCEHAGMLNHLLAKIEDLGIGSGDVVAQTAPQCFDISLWQLVAALLVGGRTLIVRQEEILDVGRFVDRIRRGRVTVLQLVPSYLDVVLAHLDGRPAALPHLRRVSVTGEALGKALAERWFARFPGVPLVNAYGLTETSDDTNHEVMTAVPQGDRVPLGRPVRNVHVYVVDERLRPVPLGAPGEIVFSGVCVGRGYVNDPERTRRSFLDDPHRPGRRLYRSGDFGRWLPDGRLEFLGRRDAQVKVRGFRIELGEVEDRLRRLPAVTEAAVIARGHGADARLIAFYAAPPSMPVRTIRDTLSAALPPYMVPSGFYWLDRLPLTGNGKIDRNRLGRIADACETAAPADPPRTPAERRLAAAWERVLGLAPGRAGRRDHFFAQGGTSLAAVRLVAALDRAISLADLTRTPVLADLAQALEQARADRPRLLQRLTGRAVSAVVCFPYAGGNAVNYQAVAAALPGGTALYAVEPPGEGLTRDGRPFSDVPTLAAAVADEIEQSGLTDVVLWGHSAGTAAAVETARLLQERGRPPRHLFLAAQLLGDLTERRQIIADLDRLDDAATAERLAREQREAGLPEHAGQAAHAAAAYRHDTVAASAYFAAVLQNPPARRLTVPVTVVVARDDPATDGPERAHRAWELLADQVTVHVLADGGHYFLHTRAAQVADLITGLGAPS